MSTLKLLGFSGEIPKLLPRLLPDMSAQRAFDTRLDDGALTPFRRSRLVFGFPGGEGANYRTIYRYKDEWLGWDTIVNAAPGPVADDRLYYTGDGPPKVRIGNVVYPLAVPMPAEALEAEATGDGEGDVQTRIYTYTFVTELGEESEPAAASNEVEWQPGQVVTLSGFEDAPAGRGIIQQRIYRSQTGSSGGTDFYLIAERPVSDDDFTDTIGVDDFMEPLQSTLWNAPPDDLAGLSPGPNGMMAAFRGKELYFCEPWRPHAWPEGYVLTTDYKIVGLGWFGSSLVVATTGMPYIVSGTHPASMVMEKLEMNLPCVNPQTVQDLGYAVAYASHDGLVVVSPGGARVATEQVITRENWMGMNPRTMVSGQHQGRYFASYTYTDRHGEENSGTIIVDLSGQMPFIIRSRMQASAFFYDIEASSLFFLDGEAVHEWDARGEINQIQSWRSKEFILPRPVNFGAILVEAVDALTDEELEAIEELVEEVRQANEEKIATGAVGGELGGSALNAYQINGDSLERLPPFSHFAAISVYADGRLVATINKVNRMMRLPSGFLARQWEVEVSGDMRIAQITLATTGTELMTV